MAKVKLAQELCNGARRVHHTRTSVNIDSLQAPDPKAYEYFGLQPPWHNNSQWMTTESEQFLFDRFNVSFSARAPNI